MQHDTPGQRLDAAVTARGSSYTAVAKALDVTRSAVGHWTSGRRDLDIDTCSRIATLLNVRVAWLAFGDGPMVDDAATPDSNEHAAASLSATATAHDGTPTSQAA